MAWTLTHEPKEFLQKYKNKLCEFEAENCLTLSLLDRLSKNPNLFGETPPHFWIHDSKAAFAMQTPPYSLILSYPLKPGIIDSLATQLAEEGFDLPGVTGSKESVDIFSKKWASLKKVTLENSMNQRIYKLKEVAIATLSPIPGTEFIRASMEHLDVILNWAYDFNVEAVTFDTSKNREEFISNQKKNFEDAINDKQFYLVIENRIPITMARTAGRTVHGRVVNYVYTPPEHRKRGLATHCVAKLSQLILDQEFKMCMLFTDLKNPTSNSIYQKIGYKPIIDSDVVLFKK